MNISSQAQLNEFLLTNFESLKVLVFLSDAIDASRNFELALRECLPDFEDAELKLAFVKDDFPGHEAVFSQYDVESVPCSIVLNANFSVLERLQNKPPGELLLQQPKLAKLFGQNLELEKTKYKQTLTRVFADNIFIIFEFLRTMLPDYEACREFLESQRVSFRRQSTMPFKEENRWVILAHFGLFFKGDAAAFLKQTPLLYFNKQLAFTLAETRELFNARAAEIYALRQTESKNLDKLLSNNKVVLFINTDSPNYSVQEAVLKALQAKKVMFSYLDIASKPAIFGLLQQRTGDKALQLPVLAVEGSRLYGQAELEEALAKGLDTLVDKKYIIESVDDRIKLLLESNPVVLFIKGTPEFPQCGFTRQILDLMVGRGVKFGYYNILADEELRERLKEYSNWKTYPQVYLNKELVGGLDIVREMIEIGQFDEAFKDHIDK